MAKPKWKIGELVFIRYPTPGYGRIVGLKKVKYVGQFFLTLTVERIFDHQGNKSKTSRKITRNEGFFVKVDQKYCDKIADSFSTILLRLVKINKESDPRRVK